MPVTHQRSAILTQQTGTRIGIDLGGTKTEGVRISADGHIEQRERLPTPANDYEAILETIRTITASLTDDKDLPVGIGTPGSVSPVSSLMRNANSTCLNGRPLPEDLERQLGRPVRIANDADCFTLSEAVDGAGRTATNVFGVILGTGVGGGLCIEGRLVSGINGIAGEWGHNPLPGFPAASAAGLVRGRDCFCGRQDCVETWLSGPGLARSYREITGTDTTALDIVNAMTAGDTQAREIMADYCERLAAALAGVINILDPGIIVLGGGLSNIEMLYQQVPAHLPRHVFSDHVATRLVRAQWGDSSGVRGAAWLW